MTFKPGKLHHIIYAILLFFPFSGIAQVKNYSIDIKAIEPIQPRTLPGLGGQGKPGAITVNNYFISKAGIPIIPITGEFHYSRYPNQYWDESIKKMKAGGINMIATYVFWNIHEEKEGVFNWTGDRDLKKFVELCAKNNMPVVLRIGPFDHGEIRNGGLPDWLLGKSLTIRENDPMYLNYVERLYNQIGQQVKGMFYKDGGPIVAVQLENELQHSAAPWGLTYPGQPYDFTVADHDRESAHEGVSVAEGQNKFEQAGNDHMKTLKSLALKAGMDAPLFTATGWGFAAQIPGETLPVTAAYAYPTWVAKKELSPFYLYKDLHHFPDYAPVRYQPMDYPAFAAELGSGIMNTYTRRPTVPAESIDALINRCLGGGANGIGYYMYHGGSTPTGEHGFFNDEAYAYPKISYDFQAPIGEYGQVRPAYYRLKLIHYFLNEFSAQLAKDVTVLPSNAASLTPENVNDLRYAVRTDGTSGFVFINNFQDNIKTEDKNDFRIIVNTKHGNLAIPEKGGISIKAGENMILPFNLDINGCMLRYTTAQLLTKNDEPANRFYVFFTSPGNKAVFSFIKTSTSVQAISNVSIAQKSGQMEVNALSEQPAAFTITSSAGIKTEILVINRATAENANTIQIAGSKHLLFTNVLVLPDGQTAQLIADGTDHYSVKVFPKIANKPTLYTGQISSSGNDKLFSGFTVQLDKFNVQPEITRTGTRKASVKIPAQLPAGLNDIFMRVDYTGDTAMGFLDGNLVTDEFYKGHTWDIGLKRFLSAKDHNFGFYFRPILPDAPYLIDLPDSVRDESAKDKELLKINSIKFIPEYKTTIKF